MLRAATLHRESMATSMGETLFDGIVCVGGEDWWYHNRGHFDFQVMRRLARRMPVLFVNSIGVRFPSPGRPGHFIGKVARKLRSLGRGLATVEPGFHVYSPVMIPGGVGQAVSAFALAPQIRAAARRIGVERPLLWVHCPAGADLLDALSPVATVLQRTDRFEAFPEANGVEVGRMIAKLKARADLVVYCNDELRAEERHAVRRSIVVTHGADVAAFTAAGCAPTPEPADIARLPRPRAAFIGGIDAHTFDPELFVDAARRLPHVTFAMIGGCTLPAGWCPLPNVHFLGRKPYDSVARYMAAADVLLMPWNRSDWIKACNPIKLKEYLAVGRPIVTTDFPALAPYRDLVHVAAGGAGFAEAIAAALATPFDAAPVRARVATETWEIKADEIWRALVETASRYAVRGAA